MLNNFAHPLGSPPLYHRRPTAKFERVLHNTYLYIYAHVCVFNVFSTYTLMCVCACALGLRVCIIYVRFIGKIFVIPSAFGRNRITPSGFMSSYDSASNKFELFH